MLEPLTLRAETLRRLKRAGFPTPPVHFPVLWESGDVPSLRSAQEMLDRAAVLNVIVNCAHGMPTDMASRWLADNGLVACLTDREHRVLAGEFGRVEADTMQVEAINALAWIVSVVGRLDASELCGDDLASKLPDLRSAEPIADWLTRSAARTRPVDAVIPEWDLHFCMTWGLAEANLRRTTVPGAMPQYVYWQRRRALEFAFRSDDVQQTDWDSIDLST